MPQTVAERQRKRRAKMRSCNIEDTGFSWKLVSVPNGDENSALLGCTNSLRAWRELGVKPGAITKRDNEWRVFDGKSWTNHTPEAKESHNNTVTVVSGLSGWSKRASEGWA